VFVYLSTCLLNLYFSVVRSSFDDIYSNVQIDIDQANCKEESNYSDSELWFSEQQKRLSRKSKGLSQRSLQRNSSVSHYEFLFSTSENALNHVTDDGFTIRKLLTKKTKSSVRSAKFLCNNLIR